MDFVGFRSTNLGHDFKVTLSAAGSQPPVHPGLHASGMWMTSRSSRFTKSTTTRSNRCIEGHPHPNIRVRTSAGRIRCCAIHARAARWISRRFLQVREVVAEVNARSLGLRSAPDPGAARLPSDRVFTSTKASTFARTATASNSLGPSLQFRSRIRHFRRSRNSSASASPLRPRLNPRSLTLPSRIPEADPSAGRSPPVWKRKVRGPPWARECVTGTLPRALVSHPSGQATSALSGAGAASSAAGASRGATSSRSSAFEMTRICATSSSNCSG